MLAAAVEPKSPNRQQLSSADRRKVPNDMRSWNYLKWIAPAVLVASCQRGEMIAVEGRPQNSLPQRGICTDSGKFYYLDDADPTAWSSDELGMRFRVKGRLFVDDRYKGVNGEPGTAGNDSVIENALIEKIP